MTITDKAVPNVVGVDIGCGMYTADIGTQKVDFNRLDATAHFIPSGRNVWEGREGVARAPRPQAPRAPRTEVERFDLEALKCYRSLSKTKWLERSLGTLGGGNHFIEVDVASDGRQYADTIIRRFVYDAAGRFYAD